MLSRAEFETECAVLRGVLETRRKRHMRYWIAGVAAAALALASALFFPQALLDGFQGLFNRHVPLHGSDIAAYRLFATLFAVFITLGPLMGYRGENGFPVERAVYARLLHCFGPFSPVAGGGLAAAELRRMGTFPPLLLFFPEEGALGEMNQIRVRLCMATLMTRADGSDTIRFKGLLIVCDPPRGSKPVMLTPANEAAIEARLAQMAQSGAGALETECWDEKLTYGLAAVYARLKGRVLSRLGRGELAAEKTYRIKYGTPLPLARLPAPQAQDVLHSPYALHPAAQGYIALVAVHGTLFTIGSLFRPALSEARMRCLYEMMQAVDALTREMAGQATS